MSSCWRFYVIPADWLSSLWPRCLTVISLPLIAIVLFLRDGLWSGAVWLLALPRGRSTRRKEATRA